MVLTACYWVLSVVHVDLVGEFRSCGLSSKLYKPVSSISSIVFVYVLGNIERFPRSLFGGL